MNTYRVDHLNRLLRDDEDTGIKVYDKGGYTLFYGPDNKGLASYGAGTYWASAVSHFVREHLGAPGAVQLFSNAPLRGRNET